MTRLKRSIIGPLAAVTLAACGMLGLADEDIVTLEVAPQTVECVGEAVQRCLQVRESPEEEWRYFYDTIEGFTYEEGYTYVLRVLRQRVDDPPADGSALRWRLLEVLSKESAGS